MESLENQVEDIFNKADQSQWELVKFGDVVHEVRDTIKNNQEVSDFRVVGLEHLTPNDIHIRSWDAPGKETTFTKRFVKGQVLFGRRRAYQRKASLAEFDGICSGDIIVMEAKDRLDPSLLPFLVHCNRFYEWAVSTSAGSLSPRTKFKDLAKFEFRLPTLSIQKKLAELLWSIDESEQKHKSFIASLQRIKLSSIDNMVVRGFSTRDFKKSPLGEVPDTWRVVSLGDFAESIQYGFTASATSKILGPKLLRITDIQDNQVNWGDVPYCVCNQVDKYKLKTGDIVFARTGATTGKSYHIKEPPEAVFASYLIRVRTSEAFDSEYVHAFFQSSFYWKQISTQTIGIAQGGFNASKLSDLLITLPPIEDQRRIVKEVAKFDHVINLANSAGESDLSLRQAVLSIL